MPSELERKQIITERLRAANTRVAWSSDAPLADKLLGWLTHFLATPHVPESLAFIDADGTRRVHDPALPAWVMPALCLAVGAGAVAYVEGSRGERAVIASFAVALALLTYLRATLTERHLVVDASRGLFVVRQGRRVIVEIPFRDLDLVYVEVIANPGYSDIHRAFVQIAAALPSRATPILLTGPITDAAAAMATARAVAERTGVALAPELQRRTPQ